MYDVGGTGERTATTRDCKFKAPRSTSHLQNVDSNRKIDERKSSKGQCPKTRGQYPLLKEHQPLLLNPQRQPSPVHHIRKYYIEDNLSCPTLAMMCHSHASCRFLSNASNNLSHRASNSCPSPLCSSHPSTGCTPTYSFPHELASDPYLTA